MKFIWLSDLHYVAEGLVQGHDPQLRLKLAVDFIVQQHSDAVACVITGDLVDLANLKNYQSLHSHLQQLPMPVLPMTGNHDDRTLLRTVLPLPDQAMADFVQYGYDFGPVRLLCLDTLIPGEDAGFLCADRLQWVEQELENAGDRPVILAMHHPPFDLGL